MSRENSDVESLSPSRSDRLSSPVLDQDHLLYPDIVLSSSHLVANLDRDNLPQQSELVKSVNEEYQEGFEEEGMTSTRISQQEFHWLDRTQLCTTENEWPLLSSLHSWPSEQSDAANLASQTLIHTHGQGTRYWQASPCQGVQLLGQGNGSHQIIFSEPKSAVAKVSPQTELEIIQVDEGGLQDEDKEEAQLEKGTEQMELNLVRSDQNVAQLGQDIALRAKYVRSSVAECEKSGVGSDEEEVGEHYPIQSGQTEAQYRPIIAQTDEVNHETVILISQNGEHKEPSFVVRLQTNPDKRNQEELTQTQHFILDLDSIQTEGDVTEMTQIAKTLAQKEQHISENEPENEFEPNKQSVAELRSEEQDRKKSEDLNTGSKKNERFTLFVVDKLFLATPDITGMCSVISSIKNEIDTNGCIGNVCHNVFYNLFGLVLKINVPEKTLHHLCTLSTYVIIIVQCSEQIEYYYFL